jgi:serralysin
VVNKNQWCFAWLVDRKGGAGADRATLLRGAMWTPGTIITVSFLDGDPVVQEKVRQAALQWTKPWMANLTLDFRKDTDTLIRISFQYEGSWSAIGTSCRQLTDKTKPTMNYGWLDVSSPDEEVQRVVLHEFGHALGLVHEHQNPGGEIHWDRAAVIRDLSGPPNNWTLDEIERNVFQPYAKQETNFTKLDPQSIMIYPIQKLWTTNGFSFGWNSALSPTDKAFIRVQYP